VCVCVVFVWNVVIFCDSLNNVLSLSHNTHNTEHTFTHPLPTHTHTHQENSTTSTPTRLRSVKSSRADVWIPSKRPRRHTAPSSWHKPAPLRLHNGVVFKQYGTNSKECATQRAREDGILATVYIREGAIPPSPAEPPEHNSADDSRTSVIVWESPVKVCV